MVGNVLIQSQAQLGTDEMLGDTSALVSFACKVENIGHNLWSRFVHRDFNLQILAVEVREDAVFVEPTLQGFCDRRAILIREITELFDFVHLLNETGCGRNRSPCRASALASI